MKLKEVVKPYRPNGHSFIVLNKLNKLAAATELTCNNDLAIITLLIDRSAYSKTPLYEFLLNEPFNRTLTSS